MVSQIIEKEKRDETCTSLAIPHQLPTNGLLMFDIPNVEKQPQQPLLVNVTICSAVCVYRHPQAPTLYFHWRCSKGRSASLPWWFFFFFFLKTNKSRSQYCSSPHLSCWSKLLVVAWAWVCAARRSGLPKFCLLLLDKRWGKKAQGRCEGSWGKGGTDVGDEGGREGAWIKRKY